MFSVSLDLVSSIGLLLVLSLVVALIAEIVHIPKVTSYLLVGLVMGPSVLNFVREEEHLSQVHSLTELAMAVVLFYLGSHFPLAHLRKIGRRALKISLGELSLTFTLVFAGILLVTNDWKMALLLGCLALATAPATTILVIKEFQSEGEVTEYTSILVALNNLVCIIAFELAFVGISLFSGTGLEIESSLTWLAVSLLASVVLGAAGGLLISYGCGLLKQSLWLVLLVGVCAIVMGVSDQLGVPYMLTFLMMGVVVANVSEDRMAIVKEINATMSLLCVMFFAVHGAELNLNTFWTVGLVGFVYIVCRIAGKFLGVHFAARIMHEPPEVRNWLGLAILAQAGAAIALCTIAAERDPALGKPIQVIILGSVVVFEILGPILTRQSLLRAGEIPIAQAIHHSSHSFLGEFRNIWSRFITSLGLDPTPKKTAKDLTVNELMRKNVKGIAQDADFDSVISHIEHSHDNIYPVVDERNMVTGVIRYPLLCQSLFDPTVSQLVRAIDLTTETGKILHPEDPLDTAFQLFTDSSDDIIPVVTQSEPCALVGVIRRSDIQALLIRKRKTDNKSDKSDK